MIDNFSRECLIAVADNFRHFPAHFWCAENAQTDKSTFDPMLQICSLSIDAGQPTSRSDGRDSQSYFSPATVKRERPGHSCRVLNF